MLECHVITREGPQFYSNSLEMRTLASDHVTKYPDPLVKSKQNLSVLPCCQGTLRLAEIFEDFEIFMKIIPFEIKYLVGSFSHLRKII